MNATNQHLSMPKRIQKLLGVRFSRVIFFIVIALTVNSSPSFCEENQQGVNEEIINDQCKNYINEFQTMFGKQMEKECNLTLMEGGFLHNFSIDTIEFYAYRRATLEEARALELFVLNKLSEKIRADPKMLDHLHMLSLTPESIGIDIHFVNLQRWHYDDGSIDNVYSKSGTNDFQKRYLLYRATDPFSDYSDDDQAFSTRFEESLEAAVKLDAALPIINPTIHEPTRFEEELHQILTSFKDDMKEKHGLIFRSSGWMVVGKSTADISEIRTKCTYLYPVSCQEARALILLATEKLLTALNNSETLRPYLKEYPFSANQLKLRMLFRKNKYFVGDVPYYDESMESAVLNENTITYYHHIPNIKDSDMHDRVVYIKESYQEAQKISKNTPPLTPWEKITKGIKRFIFNFSKFSESAIIIFFLALLFIIVTGWWLFIIPIIIIFILRRKRRHS